MSKPARNMHSMRISDDVWNKFISCAQSRGKTGTEIIAAMMKHYTEQPGEIRYLPEDICDPGLLDAVLDKCRKERIDPAQAINALLDLYLQNKVTFRQTLEATITK